MVNGIFVISLAVLLGGLLFWSFRTLPHEGRQIIASVPMVKDQHGLWQGLNLTYYGLFVALAVVYCLRALVCSPGFNWNTGRHHYGVHCVGTACMCVCREDSGTSGGKETTYAYHRWGYVCRDIPDSRSCSNGKPVTRLERGDQATHDCYALSHSRGLCHGRRYRASGLYQFWLLLRQAGG